MKSGDEKTSPDKSEGSQNFNRQLMRFEGIGEILRLKRALRSQEMKLVNQLSFSNDVIEVKEELVDDQISSCSSNSSLEKGSSITFEIKAEDANVQQITKDILDSLSNNCSKFLVDVKIGDIIISITEDN